MPYREMHVVDDGNCYAPTTMTDDGWHRATMMISMRARLKSHQMGVPPAVHLRGRGFVCPSTQVDGQP